MSASATLVLPRAGWLRNPAFDLTYTAGISLLAVLAGAILLANPKFFPMAFFLNAWLLGYHHVVSTFTRLTFDRDSFNRNRFLVVWLPLIVLGGVFALCLMFGGWMLTTIYLYWQWWHYTRQSYGISRIYQRKAGLSNDLLSKLIIYALPVWGILHRSFQAPSQFLFTDVKVLPVPLWLVTVAGLIASGVVLVWLAQTLKMLVFGTLPVAHTLYLCSHLLIFAVGYIVIDDINHGWLVLTVWHNCQYILTVWMFNNNRFKNTVDTKHRFLSFISQRSQMLNYFAVCLLISTALYSALQASLNWMVVATATTLPLFAIAFQAINFHHYVVDAVIWKTKKTTAQCHVSGQLYS